MIYRYMNCSTDGYLARGIRAWYYAFCPMVPICAWYAFSPMVRILARGMHWRMVRIGAWCAFSCSVFLYYVLTHELTHKKISRLMSLEAKMRHIPIGNEDVNWLAEAFDILKFLQFHGTCEVVLSRIRPYSHPISSINNSILIKLNIAFSSHPSIAQSFPMYC